MRTVRCSVILAGGGGGGKECLNRGCTPTPPDRMTDTCENITFPQLLRTVKMKISDSEIIIFQKENAR